MRARGTTRRWLPAAALTVAAGIGLQLLPSTASADPQTPAAAAAALQQVAQQLTGMDEQIQQAEIIVANEQKAAQTADAKAATAQAALAAFEPELRAIAQTGFTGGTRSRVAAFLTSNSATDFVQQMTTLDVIADHTETVIAQVAAAQQAAAAAKQEADAAKGKATADLATLQDQKKTLQAKATAYQASYDRLTTAQQAVVRNAIAGPTLSFNASSLPAPANATIATIIRTALAQLGKPYVYGSAGPSGFDCSGLTMFSFASGGVDLPHSSLAQSQMGTLVARADLQPGDLVFFYTPVSHVGLYIGNGLMVHARTFGSPVAVTSVDQSGYRFARRIIG